MRILLLYLDVLDNEPMGLLYIGTALTDAGHSVRIAGTPRGPCGPYLSRLFREFDPQAVGMSITTCQAEKAAEVARLVRSFAPGVPIVAGGPHPTLLAQETLRDTGVDACVLGEGEVTVVGLMEALEKRAPLDGVKGIAFIRDGAMVRTAAREYICDLDSLPFVRRDLLPGGVIYGRAGYPLENPCMLVMSVRGCPFQCTFCQPAVNSIFGSAVRRRSPENVVEEISMLRRRYGARGFWVEDDTFMMHREWTLRFCGLIRERGLRISWYANGRVNMVTRELLTAMRDAGCVGVVLTPESGSERIRNEVLGKHITDEQIYEAYRICHEIGLPAQGNIMLASPTETEADLARSLGLVSRIQPHFMNFSFTTAMPGTYLYQAYAQDAQFKEQYASFSHYHIGTLKRLKCGIPEEALQKAWKYFMKYYDSSSWINRARHFFEFPYMRRSLLRRWRSLVWSPHPKWKHLVYDLLAIAGGCLPYFFHRAVYRRRKAEVPE